MKDIWEAIKNWFLAIKPDDYLNAGGKILKSILILILVHFAIKISKRVIEKVFKDRERAHIVMDERKSKTFSALIQNILKYVLYFVAIVMVLEQFGVNTSSIIATAGIGGLAIGFGAQNLVKDIITGFFILFEDQYAVGDYIKIGNITGTVEALGLRTTKIRGYPGDLNIIPNGQISTVTNYSRGNTLAIVDVGIAYEADIEKASNIMLETAIKYKDKYDTIVSDPKILGVTNLGDFDITIRLIATTKPLQHWQVERDLRKNIKLNFDKYGIEIPYPRTVIIHNKEA